MSPESDHYDKPRDDCPGEFPLVEADRCVKCALCLPHCPTYRLSGDEGESPRGRIALMQGLARGALAPTPAVRRHLAQCLECRACEVVCPAEVPYGRLIDAGRELLARQGAGPSRGERLIIRIATQPRLRRVAVHALRPLQRFGLLRLLARGPLGHGAARLPALCSPRPFPTQVPAIGERRGRVALFTGCVSSVLERQVLDMATAVLARLGFEVVIPATQACCGALPGHVGLSGAAAELARANRAALAGSFDALVGTSSGCLAYLAEYTPPLDVPVRDLSAFLLEAGWPPEDLQAVPGRAAIHEPCTLRYPLGQAGAASDLLRRIPGLTVDMLPGNTQCCGAAGTHMVLRPGIAEPLGELKREAFHASGADWLVTSNVGCALHIGAGGQLPVTHPVVLAGQALGLVDSFLEERRN